MQLVNIGESYDPSFNLAAEEYVIRNFPIGNDYVLFYINDPSIIIGKNQNVFEEVNLRYATENKIPILRRISGGGTVYHDRGNLNFSLISKSGNYSLDTLATFISEIVNLLNMLGVPAEQNKRNDIYLDGKKISGNARFSSKDILCTHSTLLFNADIEKLTKSLDLGKVKSDSKSTKSVRSQVKTLKDYLSDELSIHDLKNKLFNHLIVKDNEIISFNENDLKKIESLRIEKYNNWEWNVGRSPKSSIERSVIYNDQNIEVAINIEDGIIKKIESENELINEFSHIFIDKKYIINELDSGLETFIKNQKVLNLFYSIF